MRSQEYWEGYSAFGSGYRLTHNPYFVDEMTEWMDWQFGWLQAQEDSRVQTRNN